VIAYIENRKIDIEKYDKCIATSLNTRIYAFSWYLNCVTDNWSVLVLNDYEAVMPLPVRKKYGLNYIYQTPWIQQLGVFSKNNIDEDLILNFIGSIPKKFVLVDYFLNSENQFQNKNVESRTNYILDLNKSFNEISKGFNDNRKRLSKKTSGNIVLKKNAGVGEFLDFYQSQSMDYKTHSDSFKKLEELLKVGNESVQIWTVKQNNDLIGGLVWLKDKNRITYLTPVANKEAKKNFIPTYLVLELIKDYQNSDYILDFEGSMIPGVAQFYKSFGAEEEEYYWYKRRFWI